MQRSKKGNKKRMDAACANNGRAEGTAEGVHGNDAAKVYCCRMPDVTLTPTTDCEVMYLGERGNWNRYTTEKALWDTGATDSQITREVAEALGLKAIDRQTSNNAGGKADVAIYKARLYLSDTLYTDKDILLAECYGANRFDCVIGMDIISLGRFTLTGSGDERTMTFEIEI